MGQATAGAGESRRYTLQYHVTIFRWPYPLQKPVIYPTAELMVMAMPDELAIGGLDLERGPEQVVAGQPLEVRASTWLAPGLMWQVIVRPGPMAGPVAGWNASLLDLPVLAELDRFPGDWLIQRAARHPTGRARHLDGGVAPRRRRDVLASRGAEEGKRGRAQGRTAGGRWASGGRRALAGRFQGRGRRARARRRPARCRL